jgi:ABC-2 type transport system ATP-binding protein
MSLKVQNICKSYGKQKALDKINFSAKPGEIVGFLGPNGAGKSTTMKIISTYLMQDNGKVFVNGIDTVANPLKAKKKIGYLPEHNPLYLEMYVKEYLELLADIHNVDKSNISQIIKQVQLDDNSSKKIRELSKGYRQRVGLAAALLHNPDILILDEPTTGLDPNQLKSIRELIKEIGKTKTVLLSTHIMQEVEAICNRVIIINKGKIVADDLIENITKDKTLTEVFAELTS